MVRPNERRSAAAHLMNAHGLSCRRACRLMRLHRTTFAHRPRPDRNVELRARLKELAEKWNRYGHPILHDMLREEGRLVNHKRTERLYRLEGLSLKKRRKKKKAMGLRQARPVPTSPDEVWSMDFVHDRLGSGEGIKCFTLIDQCTRECLAIEVNRSLKGEDVARALTRLKWAGRSPKALLSDNGPEFASRAMARWAQENGVQQLFIEPGKPTQNAFTESFNGTFRYECLDANYFLSLEHARAEVAYWMGIYNEVRPHSSVGRMAPKKFASRFEEKKLNEASRDQRL